MKALALLIIASLIIVPSTALAATFLHDEQALSLSKAITDDLFTSGQTILIDQPVEGDVFAAGERITISEPVAEDVFAAGNTIEIKAAVAQDIFVAGQTITIEGGADDVFAAGNSIVFGPNSAVASDTYVAGQTIRLRGTFGGDVRVAGQTVVVASGTKITGTLISTGGQPTIESGASVGGQKHHSPPDAPRKERGGSLLIGTITWFVAGLVARYLFPGLVTKLTAKAVQPVKTFFLGLAWLVFCLPLIIILAITVIGLPVTFFVLLFTGLLILGACTFTPIVIGRAVKLRLTKKDTPLSWQDILLGALLYNLLSYIPLVGWFISFVLTVWVLGELVQHLWHAHTASHPA